MSRYPVDCTPHLKRDTPCLESSQPSTVPSPLRDLQLLRWRHLDLKPPSSAKTVYSTLDTITATVFTVSTQVTSVIDSHGNRDDTKYCCLLYTIQMLCLVHHVHVLDACTYRSGPHHLHERVHQLIPWIEPIQLAARRSKKSKRTHSEHIPCQL